MNSPFGEVFMFLTNLAWKCRITMPLLVSTAFFLMDFRLQIEVNIHSGQVGPAELNNTDDEGNDYAVNMGDVEYYNYLEYTTDSSGDTDDESENGGAW